MIVLNKCAEIAESGITRVTLTMTGHEAERHRGIALYDSILVTEQSEELGRSAKLMDEQLVCVAFLNCK